jgi:Ca2+-transporting ATPase
MGDGTSRAKEASDITIIDNSFASINKAIMWGRSLYLNIRRFIIFQMTINLCACMIVLFGAFLGFESPLTVTQMLWVNLIMDTFAAMALSSLPADRRVLDDKPRAVDSHIIDGAMIRRIVATGILFFVVLAVLWQILRCLDVTVFTDIFTVDAMLLFVDRVSTLSITAGELTPYEMGIFFSIFVLMQFWNLFNARYFRTKRSLIEDLICVFRDRARLRESYSAYFPIIALVILLGQVVIVNCAGQLFGVAPLTFVDWLCILAVTSPVLLIPDVVRLVVRR